LVQADPDPEVRNHCAWCVARRVDHESNGISKVFAKVIEETDPASLALRYEASWHLANHLGPKAPDRVVDLQFDLFQARGLTGYSGTAVKGTGRGSQSES